MKNWLPMTPLGFLNKSFFLGKMISLIVPRYIVKQLLNLIYICTSLLWFRKTCMTKKSKNGVWSKTKYPVTSICGWTSETNSIRRKLGQSYFINFYLLICNKSKIISGDINCERQMLVFHYEDKLGSKCTVSAPVKEAKVFNKT